MKNRSGTEQEPQLNYPALTLQGRQWQIDIQKSVIEDAIRKQYIVPYVMKSIFLAVLLTGASLSIVGIIMVIIFTGEILLIIPFVLSTSFCFYAHQKYKDFVIGR